jgi:hypothetical protein
LQCVAGLPLTWAHVVGSALWRDSVRAVVKFTGAALPSLKALARVRGF